MSSRRSMAVVLFALTCLVLLADPRGDYPLADDWHYARITKRFAESGKLVLDTAVAPTLVGQVVFASPFVRILGFSHTLLRGLTLLVAVALLLAVDRLCALAGAPPTLRCAGLLTIVFNPLFGFLSLSFMTEIYGYTPALWGAVLWFSDRGRDPGRPVSWRASLGAALLVFLGFSARQLAVLVYPCLVGAAALRAFLERDLGRLKASLPALLAGTLALCASLGLYFVWATGTGNLRSEVLPSISLRTADIFVLQGGIWTTYLTAFCLPLLLLFPWRGLRGGLPAVALGLLGFFMLQSRAGSDFSMADSLHRVFPFAGNLLYNAGVGAVTLTDVYELDGPLRPLWPPLVWKVLEWIFLLGAILWGCAGSRVWRLLRGGGELAGEIALFSGLLAVLTFFAAVWAARTSVFDRYFLLAFLGLVVLLVVSAGEGRRWVAYSCLLPLAAFTALGLHDYFRWNDARWGLYRSALDSGVSREVIEAGYEVDGWNLVDSYGSKTPPEGCIGHCSCHVGWFCRDDSYAIGMNLREGYEVLASVKPRYWLAPGPPILLSRRRTPNEP